MVLSPFFLVFWPGEKKYSEVPRDTNVDGNLRKEDDLVLKALPSINLMWNRKIYLEKIVHCGTKQFIGEQLSNAPEEDLVELNENVDLTIKKSSKKRKRSYLVRTGIDSTLSAIQTENSAEQTAIPAISIPIPACASSNADLEACQSRIQELERMLAVANENTSKYKNRYKNLKAQMKIVKQQSQNDIDIGSGVTINKSVVERIKVVSPSPTIFARSLFRAVFPKEELIRKSLFGRSSNANKDMEVKPSVDESKRNAVIAYTMELYKQEESEKTMLPKGFKSCILGKIHKTLGEYIREVNNLKTDTA